MSFILSCESTVDMPFSYVQSRNIPVLFYDYTVDGVDYIDDMCRDPKALPAFYEMLAQGKMPTTTQRNCDQYRRFFEPLLQKGDLLHITLGTGLTGSYQNARLAAEELAEEYPSRRIVVVDSLCGSSGYGLLVDYAADLRDAGKSPDEILQWLTENRQKVHHQFFSTELKHYRRSGRVSGAAATVGTILNVCPIMHLDDAGRIIAYGKVRGKKNAVKTTVEAMLDHAQGGRDYDGKCFLCHSNCQEDAEILRQTIGEAFPNVKNIPIFDIGTSVASHCGPGTVAVFFLGDRRMS